MANLIVNGGFNGYSGWNLFAGATIYSNGGLSNGSYDGCLGFSNNSTGGTRDAYQSVMIVPGAEYTLSFWAKRRGRYDVWAAYQYQGVFHNFASMESKLINEQYVKISYTFTIPSNAPRDVNIWIRGGANASDGNVYLFIDNVSLEGPDGSGGTNPGTTIHGISILDAGGADIDAMLATIQSENTYAYKDMDCQKAVRVALPNKNLHHGSDLMYYNDFDTGNRGTIDDLGGIQNLQPGYLIFQHCDGSDSCSKKPSGECVNGIKTNGQIHMSHVGLVIRVDWNDGSGPQLATFQSVGSGSSPLSTKSPTLKAIFRDDDEGGPNITGFSSRWKNYGILS